MKEMSHEASQLIHAGREAFSPTDADRARLMAALTGAATLSISAAAAAGAQRSLSAIFGLGHAGRLLAVALPVAAAGTYWWHSTVQSPATVAMAPPVSPPPALVAPMHPVSPAEPSVEPQLAAPLNEPTPAVTPELRVPPAPEAAKPGVEIRQEVALLSKAQAALSRGRPQEALEALAEHAARFPKGVLTEERSATRARTLCALGRRPEAEAELKRIEKLNPSSAYLARARESCGSR